MPENISPPPSTPSAPRLEPSQELTTGDEHEVYEAFIALLEPTTFEAIALFLATMLDFVIFAWVTIRLFTDNNLIEAET